MPAGGASTNLVTHMAEPQFEIYRDEAEKWRWRLVHPNGNILADSGQGYATRQKCLQGIESVKSNVSDASVERVENS